MVPGPERTKVVRSADTLLAADLPFIPIYTYTTAQLIDTSKWEGWYPNPLDIHPWKSLGPKK
jgi:oligopeptide transport system substrate-binding protein